MTGPRFRMKLLRFLPLFSLLAACSNVQVPDVTSAITPYKIDIRQGNYLTQEMVAQLKPGMTREQVRFILGTPLVADIFHADRWDYVYTFKPGRGDMQLRRLAVFFVDNKLAKVAGDVVGADPGEAEATATEAASARSRVIEIEADAPKKKPESVEGGQKPDEAKSETAAQPAEKK